MKKLFLTIISMLAMATCAMAQETIVINGQVIPVSKIKSMSYGVSNQQLPEVMKRDEKIKLFTEALFATKLNEKLYDYSDRDYSVGADSTTWLNEALCINVATEYDNVAYPAKRYYQFTAFAETDEVLKDKYGISTLDDLRKKAHELYDPMYPEDKSVTDETDPRNALNRFVAYHILDRYAPYYKLTAIDGYKLPDNFNRAKQDVSDRYETLMPHSLVKFSFPSGSQEGLYINRRGLQDGPDYRGVFVRGAKIDKESETTALNGLYYYIDDIVAYDQSTQQVVHDERMRFDATTLSPDFMTLIHDGSMARGHMTRNSRNNYMYGAGGQSSSPANNQDLSVGFKANSIRNFEFKNEWTHIHVRPRCLYYWSYQGDEVIIKGWYDVKVKLPSLPAGTYELRFGTCTGFSSRGLNQFYINDVPMGEPVDFRPGADMLGYASDYTIQNNFIKYFKSYNQYIADLRRDYDEGYLTDDEFLELTQVTPTQFYEDQYNYVWEYMRREWERKYGRYDPTSSYYIPFDKYLLSNGIFKHTFKPNEHIVETDEEGNITKDEWIYSPTIEFDRILRNLGWMKGPADYTAGENGFGTNFRDAGNLMRRVIGTFTTDGKSDQILRIKQVDEMGWDPELDFDYIEIVPKSVYNNPDFPEDIY